MPVKTDTLQERVEAGAAMLDYIDTMWYTRINLDRLEMNHPSKCILGQLYGDYYEGKVNIWPNDPHDSDEPADKGFHHRYNSDTFEMTEDEVDGVENTYAQLGYLWKQAIRLRKDPYGDAPTTED